MRPSRRAVVAVAMVVGAGAFAASGVYVAATGGGRQEPAPAAVPATLTTKVPANATKQDYYKLAAAASEATLTSFAPPPDSTRIDGPPSGWVAGGSSPQSDSTLTRTGWWSTPLSQAEVADYLANGSPSSLTTKETSTGSGSDKGVSFGSAMFEMPGSPVYMAFSAPVLSVAFQTIGGTTYLKVVSFETARYPVPDQYRISETITSVQIDKTKTVTQPGESPTVTQAPSISYSAPGDAATIKRLVKAYNAMPADFTMPMVASCPAQTGSTTTVTTVTFTGRSGHVWTATTTPFGCGLGFTVGYGSQKFRQVLDGSTLFLALR